MEKLSVVIITYNEEKNIGRCLDAVKDIADEIVILDSFSTDSTAEIAKSYGVKFTQSPFEGYIIQKNKALALSAFPLVFSLDADEIPDETLKRQIIMIKQQRSADAFAMNRLNFYRGKPIRTCGWYPDRKIRLFDKRRARWKGELVHERLEVDAGAHVAVLEGNILHDTHPTFTSLRLQAARFAELAAKPLSGKPYAWLFFKRSFSPVSRFLKSYILQLGFTDGAAGFTISLYQAKEARWKYSLALRLKKDAGPAET